ncbi:MAG: hypothetical protein IH861_08960 [Chloroflexi bacterium]|nr:hypothetical protein [Chloroflexota bacterium]
MTTSLPLVAFNSLMIKALALNDRSIYPEELDAFSTAFRGQRFKLLITDGILVEYQTEANNPPSIFSSARVEYFGIDPENGVLGRV